MVGTYKAFFDGSAIPNPGTMRIGGYIEDPKGVMVYSLKSTLGYGTNNEAEYIALMNITTQIVLLKIQDIEIFGDSQLVVNQVNGIYKLKKKTLEPFLIKIKDNLSRVNKWSIKHVYREHNKTADSLTRK